MYESKGLSVAYRCGNRHYFRSPTTFYTSWYLSRSQMLLSKHGSDGDDARRDRGGKSRHERRTHRN